MLNIYRFFFIFILAFVLIVIVFGGRKLNNETVDSVQYAAELGRLDFISALLAIVAFIMVFCGVFAFLNIKSSAKKEARNVAQTAAEEKAEEIANLYIQANLPKILASYEDFIEMSEQNEVADKIALAQEEKPSENGENHE